MYPPLQIVLYPGWQGNGHLLPTSSSILDAYDLAGNNFLLLGDPGSGKTTLLLDLARRLLIRAENDRAQPIPVIINLSAWTSKDQPFSIWLRDQIRHYQIHDDLCESVLVNNRWILLFDGLDEVEAFKRDQCIKAINWFREEYKSPPVVVCSSRDAYLSQQVQLKLSSTVEIQPLQTQEVRYYLAQIGEPAAAILAVHHTDAAFQHLLTNPLMLNIILLTYSGKARRDIPPSDSPQEQQRQIIEHYMERMLEQQTSSNNCSPQKARKWLAWLSQQMNQQHLTEFYLEELQPTWLSTKRTRTTYYWLIGPVLTLVLWLIAWAFFGIVNAPIHGVFEGQGTSLTFDSPMPGLIELLVIAFTIELVCIRPWVQKIHSRANQLILPTSTSSSLLVALLAGLISGVIIGLFGGPREGALFGFNFGMASLYLGIYFGRAHEGQNWKRSYGQIDEKNAFTPDRGIQNVGLLTLYGGLAFVLFSGWYDWLESLSLYWLYPFLLVILPFLGRNYLLHYVLRFSLWQSGAMPWHYVSFLEDMCERNLMQHVGNGYCFIHPCVQLYFASQGIEVQEIMAEGRY